MLITLLRQRLLPCHAAALFFIQYTQSPGRIAAFLSVIRDAAIDGEHFCDA